MILHFSCVCVAQRTTCRRHVSLCLYHMCPGEQTQVIRPTQVSSFSSTHISHFWFREMVMWFPHENHFLILLRRQKKLLCIIKESNTCLKASGFCCCSFSPNYSLDTLNWLEILCESGFVFVFLISLNSNFSSFGLRKIHLRTWQQGTVKQTLMFLLS